MWSKPFPWIFRSVVNISPSHCGSVCLRDLLEHNTDLPSREYAIRPSGNPGPGAFFFLKQLS